MPPNEHDDFISHRIAKVEEDQKAIRERLHTVSNHVQALTLKRDADHEISSQYRQQQTEHMARQDKQLVDIQAGIGEIKTLMIGDGTEKNPGMAPRLANVEKTQAGWSRIVWLLVAATVTAVVSAAAVYLRGTGR